MRKPSTSLEVVEMAAQAPEHAAMTPHKPRVLIVEDDAAVSKLIKTYLEREGYEPSVVETVAGLRAAAESGKIDLVIPAIVLPDEDGWSGLRWLRARSSVPVIMLTAKCDTVDKVIGLELGADDYLAKPFDLRELLARMHSVQRRTDQTRTAADRDTAAQVIKFAEWVLDLSSQQLKSDAGEPVHL